jgi:hypothetical protein
MQVDLPAALGVDLLHCERQAAAAVGESSGRVQLIQGELITLAYFDSLAAEVNDTLQVSPAAAPLFPQLHASFTSLAASCVPALGCMHACPKHAKQVKLAVLCWPGL